jgi:hypothetical protein
MLHNSDFVKKKLWLQTKWRLLGLYKFKFFIPREQTLLIEFTIYNLQCMDMEGTHIQVTLDVHTITQSNFPFSTQMPGEYI